MARTASTTLDIREGRLYIHGRIFFDRDCAALPDGVYSITVAPVPDAATWAQHKYYRGQVLPYLVEKTGYTWDQWHDYVRERWHYREITNPMTGEVRRVPESLAHSNKDRFSRFLTNILEWAALPMPEGLGLYIPGPKEG